MKRKYGFTLVELLAVISILALLLVLVIPNVVKVSDSSKESLLKSKIRSIETAAEKYGSDKINDLQKCTGSSLADSCFILVSDLVKQGYISGDKGDQILDPTTNKELDSKIKLCYNAFDAKIEATYVQSGDESCPEYDTETGNSLALSENKGVLYVNGAQKEVEIIKQGQFTFECSSSNVNVATCEVVDNKSIIISPTKTPTGNEMEIVEIILKGNYQNDSGSTFTMQAKYTATVYTTSLTLEDKSDVCIPVNTSVKVPVKTSSHAGVVEVVSDDEAILSGTYKDGTLTLSTKDKTGLGHLTVSEKNGNAQAEIQKNVYKMQYKNFLNSTILNGKVRVSVDLSGTGEVTVSSSNPEYVLLSKNEDGTNALSSIELSESDSAFTIVGIKSTNGLTEDEIPLITMVGETCGEYSTTFKVSSLDLEERSGTLYVGGESKQIGIVADDTTGLTCSSSNEDAATCYIEGKNLYITPHSKIASSVSIVVTNAAGGYVSYIVDVLEASISLVDGIASENKVTQVCSESGGTPDKSVYVRGSNFGTLSIASVDSKLVDAKISTSGTTNMISLASRYLPSTEATGRYTVGYNTGRTEIKIKEGNGNHIESFFYNTYTLELSSTSGTVSVDDSITFDVQASSTGEISVYSDNPTVASVQVFKDDAYDSGVNAVNRRTIEVTGNMTGETTIHVRGSECGEKTYKIVVTGRKRVIYLKKGSYTESLGSEEISCVTTGIDRTCEATLPEIITSEPFEPNGYHYTKDSVEYSYKPGDVITLDEQNDQNMPGNEDKYLYGNSIDITGPNCRMELIDGDNVVIGDTFSFNVVCEDLGSGVDPDSEVTIDDFIVSDPENGKVTGVTKTAIERGYNFKIDLESSKPGTFDVQFKSSTVYNLSKKGNPGVTLSNLFSTPYKAQEEYFVGKENPDDVIAALYDNTIFGGEEGTYTLELYGVGEMDDYGVDTTTGEDGSQIYLPAPWNENYRNSITKAVFHDGITNVGIKAFLDCSLLSEVTLSNDTIVIDTSAFYGTDIKSLVIPDSVVTIADYAFYINTGLTSLKLGSSIETIGTRAFDLNSLEELTIPKSVTSIGEYAFRGDFDHPTLRSLTFEEGTELKVIETGVFAFHALEELDIPDSIEYIGAFAFTQDVYSTLKYLNFTEGSNLKIIGGSAFASAKLESLSLPSTVEEIGRLAFSGLSDSIESFTVGRNVSRIIGGFADGKNLKEFIVEDGNEYFITIDGVLYDKDLTTLVDCPDAYYREHSTLDIPSTVYEILDYAFYGKFDYLPGTTGMTINLPSGITTLNPKYNFTFYTISDINITDNSFFTSIDGVLYDSAMTILYSIPCQHKEERHVIPDTVTTIADVAGYYNNGTMALYIPESIISIGLNAFTSDPEYAYRTVDIDTESLDPGSFTGEEFSIQRYLESSSETRTINVKSEELATYLSQIYMYNNIPDITINFTGGSS